MRGACFHSKPTTNTVHANSEINQHRAKSFLCLANERLREMLLNGGSGGIILEAKALISGCFECKLLN